MIFLMGLPASGKTSTASERFESTHVFIDSDEIKKENPAYNPLEAFKVHEWSKVIEEQMFSEALRIGGGRWVLDGTGVNAEKMVRRIKQAREAGFSIKLFYVTCTLETSLRRAAKRERQVPQEMIIEKARDIAAAFEIVSAYVDSVETVDNDAERV